MRRYTFLEGERSMDRENAETETEEEIRARRIKHMMRDLIFYDPRRLMITREDLDELGIVYDEALYGPLYVPK